MAAATSNPPTQAPPPVKSAGEPGDIVLYWMNGRDGQPEPVPGMLIKSSITSGAWDLILFRLGGNTTARPATPYSPTPKVGHWTPKKAK